jgi:formylglycine-generating enzyme required for sulfatase activity
MVDVRGEFCIDRYESSYVDARSGLALSPHYHPTRAQTKASYERYLRRESRDTIAVPEPPAFQLESDPTPEARSLAGVLPQGYLSQEIAARACQAAGKRLCSLAEWVRACRGEQNRKFPYGDQYREGACNVFREVHPAARLHGDASREHLDPRLGLVSGERGPLLRRSGETLECRSAWGSDGVFDMVGNLDEWVADGGFSGGFFSRGTREGCDARITSHPPQYFDYSLGARCCR